MSSTQNEHGDAHDSEHAQKRVRSSGWPLKHATVPNSASCNSTPRGKDSKVSLEAVPVPSIISARSSKFLEGSMNDRVSSQPPTAFMADGEELLDRFLAENKVEHYFQPVKDVDQLQMGGLTHHPNQSISQTAPDESKPRQSGIFRFGRSLASAFNPVNIWKEVSTKWKETAKEFDPVVIQNRQQKAKAEEVYAKMKEDGSLYTHGAACRDKDGKILGVAFYPDRLSKRRASTEMNVERERSVQRDSGIDVDSYRSSAEEKLGSRVSTESGKLEPPTAPGSIGRLESPVLDNQSAQRSLLKFKKPSMPSLKKIRSEVQLASSERRVGGDASSLIPDNDTPTPAPTKNHTIRKEPSKKDLQMQQKLTKRVSDLENKLEAARRDLNQVLGDAPPMQQAKTQPTTRKPFVPGALSSLPSEGVLAAQGATDATEDEEDTIECKVKENLTNAKVSDLKAVVSRERKGNNVTSLPQEATPEAAAPAKAKKKPIINKGSNKRRSSGGAETNDSRYKPDNDDDDDAEWDNAAKAQMPPKRKPGRPKRSLDLSESATPAVVDAAPVSKRKKTTGEAKENVPAASVELNGPRISDFVVQKTTTEYKSVMHLNQPGSAVLGRPRSATPGRGSRGHRRSTSPPPSLSYSKPVTRQSSASEDPISIVPGQNEVPPVPKMPKGLERIVRLTSVDLDPVVTRAHVDVDPEKQALHREKDDFEWPEDVF